MCYSKVGKNRSEECRERETNLANLTHTQGAASLGREIGSYLSIERELDNTVALACDTSLVYVISLTVTVDSEWN